MLGIAEIEMEAAAAALRPLTAPWEETRCREHVAQEERNDTRREARL